MAHLYRFLGILNQDGTWSLDAEEAAHLKNVLRLKVGDSCEVMDGKGQWASGEVLEVRNKSALIKTSSVCTDKKPDFKITLALGVLKAASLDDLLPCITELGIDQIDLFLQAETAKNRATPKAEQRWNRIVLQSVKQCKRSFIPQINMHENFGSWLALDKNEAAAKIVLDPYANATLNEVCAASNEGAVTLVVGGEKGLSDSELESLKAAGYHGAAIGTHVLRAYTAAIAAVTSAAQWRHQKSLSL